MKSKINNIKINSDTKALIVSDIHLRLPVSRGVASNTTKSSQCVSAASGLSGAICPAVVDHQGRLP